MAKNKRLKAAYAAVDPAKAYTLPDAIKLIKSVSKAKFDETIEMSMNLGIDPRAYMRDTLRCILDGEKNLEALLPESYASRALPEKAEGPTTSRAA